MKVAVFLLFALLAIHAVVGTRDQFEEFKRRYSKQYPTAAENEFRYRIFESSIERARSKNTFESLAVYGITKYSDLTPAEFKRSYLMPNFDKNYLPAAPIWDEENVISSRRSLPSEYDWNSKGKVTPVNNQEQCGSCWAFSATETIESVWAIAGHSLVELSEQQIVSCDTSDDGCEGGYSYGAYQYIISAGGQEPSNDYPYTAEDGTCSFAAGDIVAKISSWKYVTQSKDETAVQNYVFSNSPVSVCVDAEIWQDYQGGVITAQSNCGDSIDHCVQITGWSNQNSTNVWNVRNSWGEDWGEHGYIWVEIGSDICGIAEVVTVPVV